MRTKSTVTPNGGATLVKTLFISIGIITPNNYNSDLGLELFDGRFNEE